MSENSIFVATGVCDGWIPGVKINGDTSLGLSENLIKKSAKERFSNGKLQLRFRFTLQKFIRNTQKQCFLRFCREAANIFKVF